MIVPQRAPLVALVVVASLSLAAGCVLDRKGQQPLGADDGRGGAGGAPSDGGGGRVEGVCGDGVLNVGEVCDGSNVAGESCDTLGFAGGVVACTAGCELDTSGCEEQLCGNGVIDAGERCDGDALAGATCLGEGFAGGAIVCDPDLCQLSGCRDHYVQDFEAPEALSKWTSSGVGPWSTTTQQAHGGVRAAQSADIGNFETTGLLLALTYEVAGEISFWYRTSSETGYDLLGFLIDGVEQDVWSGALDWAQVTYVVAPGDHVFEWRYTKDGGVSSLDDTVWIDDVAAINGYHLDP